MCFFLSQYLDREKGPWENMLVATAFVLFTHKWRNMSWNRKMIVSSSGKTLMRLTVGRYTQSDTHYFFLTNQIVERDSKEVKNWFGN